MKRALPTAIALSALLTGCMQSSGPAASSGAANSVVAELKDTSGKSMGRVALAGTGEHLIGTIEAVGLSPGEHGMHIHAIGKCDPPDFTSAGGHLNPTGKQHGLDNPNGAHQGDLPQLMVKADGSVKQNFSAHSSIEAILDGDGGAFVVHAGRDDQMTDPSGNSGARVLCGVFRPG